MRIFDVTHSIGARPCGWPCWGPATEEHEVTDNEYSMKRKKKKKLSDESTSPEMSGSMMDYSPAYQDKILPVISPQISEKLFYMGSSVEFSSTKVHPTAR